MAQTPLLVSEANIKKYGIIENNVDPKLIEATIVMVQDIQLQAILGSSLYNDICAEVISGTISADYVTLLDDYIANFLMNAVIADGCTVFLYRFSNKGPVTSNSDNDFPISTEQVDIIEAKWTARASFYAKRLSLFLCENSTLYPLYTTGNTEAQDLQPQTNNYHIGWALNNKRRS